MTTPPPVPLPLDLAFEAGATPVRACFDAAYPPAAPPAGAAGALGYLPSPLATHPWTLDEWQPFAALRQYPAYVCAIGGVHTEAPAQAGIAAVRNARALGWNKGRVIVGDMETSADRLWWRGFAAAVAREDYVPVSYGSLSTVTQLGSSRLWVARWNGSDQLPEGWWAVQYTDAGTMDWSALSPALWVRGGQGPRRAPK